MPIRNRHRLGRHLVKDDRTGFIHWDDEIVEEEETQLLVRKGRDLARNPQDFVRPMNDPDPVRDVRPPDTPPENLLFRANFVPGSGVRRGPSPLDARLPLPGIGAMAIGSGTACGFDFEIAGDDE